MCTAKCRALDGDTSFGVIVLYIVSMTLTTLKRMITTVIILALATLALGGAPAHAGQVGRIGCATFTHNDVTNFTEVNGGEALAPVYIPGGAGMRTHQAADEVHWAQAPPALLTNVEDIRELSYRAYRVGTSGHVVGVRLTLTDGTTLRWHPTPAPAGFWQSYNLTISPTFVAWKTAYAKQRVSSYGIALGPSEAGAESRFTDVVMRGARGSCVTHRWAEAGVGARQR